MDDRWLMCGAVATAVSALVAPGAPWWVVIAVSLVAVARRSPALVIAAVVLVVGARADVAIAALDSELPASVTGVADLVSDPERSDFGTQVVLRAGGRLWWADVPRDLESQVRGLLTGDRILIEGRPRVMSGVPRSLVLSRHLAGRLALRAVEPGPPTPWFHAIANEVHRRLEAGSRSFDEDRRSLFLGLVIGDDRGQSDLMAFRFRASGLGHLLAVSGQNVAFLLAVTGPLLGRIPLRGRWAAITVLLVLFALTTRAEPSVLRAVAMSGTAALASSMGRVASGARVIGVAVIGLLIADPLLVHSLGFRLSVAASASLLLLARPIARRIPGPRWLADPLAVTLAAQIGTAPLLIGLNGGLPPLATVANLLAVPAAGLVMMLGLTSGFAAGWVRDDVAAVLQVPSRMLVGWIDGVATLTARVPLLPLSPVRLALVALLVGVGGGVVVDVRRRRRARFGADEDPVRGPTAAAPLAGAVALVGSLMVVALVSWPPSRLPGRHPLGAGVTLVVDRCGGRSVELAGQVRTDTALEVLWTAGVVRADRVIAAGGSDGRTDAVADALAAMSKSVASAVPCQSEGAP